MKYRTEIDGLRALAVLPVILFHAGYEMFSGGFIGVDVFFVISGYLITTLLIEDMRIKRFNIFNFYERRARRILPTLFFVMLACIPFSLLWMLPDPLENFGQSIVATTFFANNVLLHITSGYWDLASEFKPLLHTWSLGIEEQYYILFPMLLMSTWKFGEHRILWILSLVAIVSFVMCEVSFRNQPEVTFFMTHIRAWELLLGSIIALVIDKKGVKKSNLLSFLGLSAVFVSIFAYDDKTPFPGIYTLLPVLGVVLLILFAHRDTLVARALSTKALVGIGLVSYSAYLWHQPLFAFSKIYNKTQPGEFINLLLVAFTFLLSYFSWKYIERPFRDRELISRKFLLISLLILASILLIFGYSAYKTQGFIYRAFDENVSPDDMYISYNQRNFEYKQDVFENGNKTNVLVIGHSFGRDMVNVLRETYDLNVINLVYRDDFEACSLLESRLGTNLLVNANVVIFASNYSIRENSCNLEVIGDAKKRGTSVFFVGGKHFGYNLNWVMRIKRDGRAFLRNPISNDVKKAIDHEKVLYASIPSSNIISIMRPLLNDEGVLITDQMGRLISPDRVHLTKHGAIFIGRDIISKSLLHPLLASGVSGDE